MTTRTSVKARARGAAKVAAASASWLALVAATTVGVGSLHRVRAAVTVDARQLGGADVAYRLVVQSYAPESFGSSELPAQRARPLASTQRAVTRDELARGVAVDVLGVSASEGDAPVIVAWVERGKPDLEFDALEARPSHDAVYGVATTGEQTTATPIVLSRRRTA
ncbi:MAG TPA: hypothetical protein VFZ53_21810 [Polyangiaceae bacterium]